MARKSRSGKVSAMPAVSIEYRVAVYARLSKEKEETVERGTIQNQISMIRGYVERHEDMKIADIYVDM